MAVGTGGLTVRAVDIRCTAADAPALPCEQEPAGRGTAGSRALRTVRDRGAWPRAIREARILGQTLNVHQQRVKSSCAGAWNGLLAWLLSQEISGPKREAFPDALGSRFHASPADLQIGRSPNDCLPPPPATHVPNRRLQPPTSILPTPPPHLSPLTSHSLTSHSLTSPPLASRTSRSPRRTSRPPAACRRNRGSSGCGRSSNPRASS